MAGGWGGYRPKGKAKVAAQRGPGARGPEKRVSAAGGQSAYSDGELLTILDLIEREGMTLAAVGARFGASRSAMAGIVKRLRDELRASEEAAFPPGQGPARRPENRDGGMPGQWWRAGLAARRVAA